MAKTYFFWDPLEDNIVQERDETGALLSEYTTEPTLYGNVISQNRGGAERQYHFDAVGSTLALTDDSQQVTDIRAYTAFGETTESTGNTIFPFQYVGQKEYLTSGGTGEVEIRRRQYRPTIARWLLVDPLLPDTTFSAPVIDPYGYVQNNPANHVDPSGLACPGCSVPWTPQPVLGFEFQYGCYCGLEKPPLRPPPLPPPLDPIDTCCQGHDTCCVAAGLLGTAPARAAARTICNALLCTCATTAHTTGCAEKAPRIDCCCNAARKVAGVFCAVMGPEFC